jgi:hypothetical protein
MIRVLSAAAILIVGLAKAAWAGPESIVEPMHNLTGPESAGRFGSSLACSIASAVTNNRSLVAVGAPDVNSGAGRVYVYDSSNPPQLLQTLVSPSAGSNKNFGHTVTFVDDLDGDGREELVVGEPHQVAAQGSIYLFLSQGTGEPFQATACASYQDGTQGYGATLLRFRWSDDPPASPPTVILAVGAPVVSRVSSVVLTYALGVCNISAEGRLDASVADGRFGHSLAEVRVGTVRSNLLIGRPERSSNSGEATNKVPFGGTTTEYTGNPGEYAASAVAGSSERSIKAISIPGANAVRAYYGNGYNSACTKTIALSDVPLTSGSTLADLNGSFLNYSGGEFFNPADTTLASYQTQVDTGGSLALFAVSNAGACGTDIKPLNSCIFDSNAQQGYSIFGGGTSSLGTFCRGVGAGGVVSPMLLVGAPGWSTGRGYVSVYFENQSFSLTPTPCSTPTPTPTPTSTAGGAGSESVVVGPGVTVPAPTIISITQRKSLTANVQLPSVSFLARYLKSLMKALSLGSLNAAARYALRNSLFEVTIREVETVYSASIEPATAAARNKGRKIKVSVRRNRVALRGLQEGKRYEVKYRVLMPVNRRRTASTRPSPPLVFTARRT